MDNQTTTCSMCATPFKSQDELMKHAQTDHAAPKSMPTDQQPAPAQESFKCTMCGASFSSKDELETHAKEHQAA